MAQRFGMIGLFLVALASLAAAASPASAADGPSFDCGKSRTVDEKLICGSPQLMAADRAMADAYRTLLAAIDSLDPRTRDRTRAEQRAWINQRNRDCGLALGVTLAGDADRRQAEYCLTEAFSFRRRELEAALVNLPLSADLVTERVGEANKAQRTLIRASYPRFADARQPGETAFNAAMKDYVDGALASFREEAGQAGEEPGGPPEELGSDLTLSYEYQVPTPRVVSVRFDLSEYLAGAAHGNTATHAITLDLERARPLTAADLFAPGSGWVAFAARRSLDDLRTRARADNWELFVTTPKDLDDLVGDLSNWHFRKDGAAITFDVYTVGPYAVGPQEVVIPYGALKPFLRPDAPLPRG